MTSEQAKKLMVYLDAAQADIDEDNSKETERLEKLIATIQVGIDFDATLSVLTKLKPKLVLFSNYFRVRPIIHLAKLAQRVDSNLLDDDSYDYGNLCLLKLLGLSPNKLSVLGKSGLNPQGQIVELDSIRADLDQRDYTLNAASVRLTKSIREVWNPNPNRAEADRLRIKADGQYLKVVVEDELGVEVELDQRSEGFQWLVSFFVVFFAEAQDKHENAILLLDEPGLHLHGLKQRDFRETLSRLAKDNQTIFTTHSPFLVGPDELADVRVVEMTDRNVGTKVLDSITASDPAGLLPLQEALGYDLAQSLFIQARNLLVEGITDYWYIQGTSDLLRVNKSNALPDNVAVIPAGGASKVVYFATILHAHSLKIAAILDSDNAGDQAAKQETLVHALKQKAILRTEDFLTGNKINNSEIEDMLRSTLLKIVNDEFGKDVSKMANNQSSRSIIDIFTAEIDGFSKYRLAKAYLRWCREHTASDLAPEELSSWEKLFYGVARALK